MAPRKLGKAAATENVAVAADDDVSAPKKTRTAAKPAAVVPKQSYKIKEEEVPKQTKTGRNRQPKAVKAVAAEPDKFSPMHLRSGKRMVELKTTSKEKPKKEPARKVAKSPEEAEIKKQNAAIQEDDSKTKSVKNIKKNAKKANAAMNTHFDAKKKQKKEQAATSSMATTAAVDEEETTEDTTTENGRAVIDEMTASSDIDKKDTKDISLNKHVSENKEGKLHLKLNETPVSTK